MKAKFFILAALFSLAFTSCKNNDGEKKTEEAKPVVKQNFSVEVNVVAQKDDNFTTYFTEDGTNKFNADKAVWGAVKGQAGSQTIVFDLSPEIIPTNVRLDFGLNKDQGDVVLEKFKFSYYGKSFEAKGSDFLKYFYPNDSVKTEVDEVKGTIKFLRGPKKYNTPFYDPQPTAVEEIKKITK
jgi:hypothetical protein